MFGSFFSFCSFCPRRDSDRDKNERVLFHKDEEEEVSKQHLFEQGQSGDGYSAIIF